MFNCCFDVESVVLKNSTNKSTNIYHDDGRNDPGKCSSFGNNNHQCVWSIGTDVWIVWHNCSVQLKTDNIESYTNHSFITIISTFEWSLRLIDNLFKNITKWDEANWIMFLVETRTERNSTKDPWIQPNIILTWSRYCTNYFVPSHIGLWKRSFSKHVRKRRKYVLSDKVYAIRQRRDESAQTTWNDHQPEIAIQKTEGDRLSEKKVKWRHTVSSLISSTLTCCGQDW